MRQVAGARQQHELGRAQMGAEEGQGCCREQAVPLSPDEPHGHLQRGQLRIAQEVLLGDVREEAACRRGRHRARNLAGKEAQRDGRAMEGALQVGARVPGIEQIAKCGPFHFRQYGTRRIHQDERARRALGKQGEACGKPTPQGMPDEHRRAESRSISRQWLEDGRNAEVRGLRRQPVAGQIDEVDPMRAREWPDHARPSCDRVTESVQHEQVGRSDGSTHSEMQAVDGANAGAALGDPAQERQGDALQPLASADQAIRRAFRCPRVARCCGRSRCNARWPSRWSGGRARTTR